MDRALKPGWSSPTAMSLTDPICRRRLAAVTAGACVLAIAGCGSSGPKPGDSSHRGSFLAFSECMRSHGVPGFPDPSPRGGINLDGTGVNPFSPAFKTAQASCKKLLPGGGPGSQQATEQQKQQLVAISECMRSHGVPGFPDPTTKRPTSPQGYSIVEDIASNLFLVVPSTINPSSPAFQKAASACKFH
jgi:hypothetical protein